jgi:hypothetical protein
MHISKPKLTAFCPRHPARNPHNLNSHLFHPRQNRPILTPNKKSATKLTGLTKLQRLFAANSRHRYQTHVAAIRFAFPLLKSGAAPKYRTPFSTVYLRFLFRFSTVFHGFHRLSLPMPLAPNGV